MKALVPAIGPRVRDTKGREPWGSINTPLGLQFRLEDELLRISSDLTPKRDWSRERVEQFDMHPVIMGGMGKKKCTFRSRKACPTHKAVRMIPGIYTWYLFVHSLILI